MSRAAQWRLLSDLHLGVSDDDPRRPGSMLPEFLRHQVFGNACSRLPIGPGRCARVADGTIPHPAV